MNRSPSRLIAALALAGCAVAVPTAQATGAAPGGSFTKHTYTAPNAGGSRAYWLYLPPGGNRPHRPLVVFLHGCNQTGEEAAAATHFNTLAAQRGFAVVYPQQNVTSGSSAPLVDGNGIGCWNWFLPQDQQRDSGEPGLLAGLTRTVAATLRADPHRVYVEGISAGADMAVILGTTYPDVFAAVGVLAGCAYDTCGDATGAETNAAMGARARVVPMFVENGTADTLNNVGMATGLVKSWLGADDFADDGTPDGSVSPTPASTKNLYFDQTPQPGSGDVCVHNNTLTCPGGVIGFEKDYPTTVQTYDDAHGCDVLEFWLLHGMEHAQPDAPGDGPYTDPLGPDITTASFDFFANHPMGATCKR